MNPVDAVVVCLLNEQNKTLLLARSLKGLTKGFLSPPGGKGEPQEVLYRTAVRETKEEYGVEISSRHTQHVGLLSVHWGNEIRGLGRPGAREVRLSIYVATKWTGGCTKTEAFEKAEPFSCDALPFSRMLATDQYWISPVLEGRTVSGDIWCHWDKKGDEDIVVVDRVAVSFE